MAHVQKRYQQYMSLETPEFVWKTLKQVYVKLFHSSADSNVHHNYTGWGEPKAWKLAMAPGCSGEPQAVQLPQAQTQAQAVPQAVPQP